MHVIISAFAVILFALLSCNMNMNIAQAQLKTPFRIVMPKAPVRPGASFDISIIPKDERCHPFLFPASEHIGYEPTDDSRHFIIWAPERHCGVFSFTVGCKTPVDKSTDNTMDFEVLVVPSPKSIVSIDISINEVLPLGAVESFFVHAGTKDGKCLDVSSRAVGTKYTVKNASIVSLNPDGTVTAKRVGKTKITAKLFGLSASREIEVIAAEPDRTA